VYIDYNTERKEINLRYKSFVLYRMPYHQLSLRSVLYMQNLDVVNIQ
jgi:hypothetical protein